MDNLTPIELETLICVKKMVCSVSEKGNAFSGLSKQLERLCQRNCKHNWLQDLIDVTPDTSAYVIYCEYCECKT